MDDALNAQFDRIASMIVDSSFVLVFTGAGISTGSGIPDFRGPKGLWRTWRPVYYHEFLSSHEARARHWEFKLASWKDFRNAQPNQAHLALAELYRLGRVQALVTQNIDGLHQLAGYPPTGVVELHGTNRLVECITCGEQGDPDPVFQEFEITREPPVCRCGGFLKPATISFGQAMPEEKMIQAAEAALRADLVISVGSTPEVEPAASIPCSAKRQGASYVIVNQGPTAHDYLADVRVEGDAQTVLTGIVECVREKSPG